MKPTDARKLAVCVTYKVPFPASKNPQLWIDATPVFLNGDTFDRPSKWYGDLGERALTGLTLALVAFAEDGWMNSRVEYLDMGDLDRHELKRMLQCIERVQRHMDRQTAQNGTPESAGEYVQYFARALGAAAVVFDGRQGRRSVDLAQARFEVNGRVFDHCRQYGPPAAAQAPAEVVSDPTPDLVLSPAEVVSELTPDCCSVLHPCDSIEVRWPRWRA